MTYRTKKILLTAAVFLITSGAIYLPTDLVAMLAFCMILSLIYGTLLSNWEREERHMRIKKELEESLTDIKTNLKVLYGEHLSEIDIRVDTTKPS